MYLETHLLLTTLLHIFRCYRIGTGTNAMLTTPEGLTTWSVPEAPNVTSHLSVTARALTSRCRTRRLNLTSLLAVMSSSLIPRTYTRRFLGYETIVPVHRYCRQWKILCAEAFQFIGIITQSNLHLTKNACKVASESFMIANTIRHTSIFSLSRWIQLFLSLLLSLMLLLLSLSWSLMLSLLVISLRLLILYFRSDMADISRRLSDYFIHKENFVSEDHQGVRYKQEVMSFSYQW